MTITRAKASRLLNQSEMALYDESRINGLRQLDARALGGRINRARTARDRARDLLQKQKLSSRSRTGSKRGSTGTDNQRSKDKATLLADILKRFETRLREVERSDKAEARAAAKAATADKAASKKSAASKATKKTASNTASKTASKAASKAASKKAASKKAATAATLRNAGKDAAADAPKLARKAARPAAGRKPGETKDAAAGSKPSTRKTTRKRRITPEQALAQTQALLEAKHARDQQPREWEHLDGGGAPGAGAAGYQSPAAASRALQLHAAESRLPAIQGSSSTRDRLSQGKRDRRGQDGE